MDIWLILYALIFLFAIPRAKWHRRPDPLFESNNPGGDTSQYSIYGANWEAETFTVGAVHHTVASVKGKWFRSGSPGTLTVSIRKTDASGHPTGSDLNSGSINANTFVTTPGAWYEVPLSPEIVVDANTKYAICARAPTGNSSNWVGWRLRNLDYTGGNPERSTDGGVTWSAQTLTYDMFFEVWGNYIVEPPYNCSVFILSETSLQVSWVDGSTDEDDFHIERKVSGGSYSEVQIVASTTKTTTGTVYTWDNSGLLIQTTYYYRVRAHRHSDNVYSSYSNEAYNTTPFYAPTNLVAIALNIDAILAQWVDNSQVESDYHLERKTSLEPTWAERTILPANSTQFTDPGLDPAIIYTYKVRAHNHAQDIYTTYSNEASEAPKLLAQIPFNPFTPLLGYY